jgi:hypothetical protein
MTKVVSPLVNIFEQVAKTLVENQQDLNQADSVNHDHGDNMVSTFQTIAQSLQKKQGVPDSQALEYAAKMLAKNSKSGSGELYAKGLSQAASTLEGKQFDPQMATQLLQALIGGGTNPAPQESQSSDGDLLSSILGGLAETTSQKSTTNQDSGDLLGSLLGGLVGGNSKQSTNDGIDMGDLLNAGMAFMSAKQQGGNNIEALMQAFMAANGMGTSAHRQQSTQLVVGSFLKALGSMQ